MSTNYTTLSEDYATLENGISWDDFYSQYIYLKRPNVPY